MLDQKLFFKDLLDYSSSKSNLSKKLDVKKMPRLSEIISNDDEPSTGEIELPEYDLRRLLTARDALCCNSSAMF